MSFICVPQVILNFCFKTCFGNEHKAEEATRDVLIKKGVLKNLAKFTGKHLCQSLFNKVSLLKRDFNKVSLLKRDFNKVSLLKRDSAQVFSCEFCKVFKNTFFTEHLGTTAFDLS